MKKFDQKQQPKLESNLQHWDNINEYSHWIFQQYQDYVGRRILDIGIGIGNMTQFYLDKVDFALGVDIFPSQLEIVKKRFPQAPLQTKLLNLEKDSVQSLKKEKFDTIIAINVFEHLEDDDAVLKKLTQILVPGGHIIIFVPAMNQLYNYMDKNAGHFRRYGRGELQKLAIQVPDLQIVKHKYFNCLGTLPYYLKGKLTSPSKQQGTFSCSIDENQSKLYNIATQVLRPIENIISVPCGLSQYIVLKKIK